ncbi:acetyl-CoA carboxylase biotin carboxyl carrier protein [Rhizobium redzepovicii]|jgi:acetyl-CoA carboxylase biotin carboxyl carrier protein|uniref:Biotin carboxyl carrier protein of acetyl-CoA carboxylase n=1 Tax=Rhizobium redzepovicii TaxID=2867518 RepID=A0AAW8PAH1_9HYPH|nr:MULTISPECIES: acetyl-CoA carboxylase biotin carboxyl carrier protein [Rhizobium]MBB3522968.1 acetyl-CoA carboxylase biotin carboxyl carrier protein [Rhizobium sp. BK456]MBY4589442.1 acetyl-CoA carboxylase biotin carboxyl carrier protein [Rhizobium redzepovicii]MBY4613715.1 acetyl-CoA carboxylase biotin carboxyl carrier protein [Rhizobium redzepovicii]MDF0658730.1 acetyl-CoA carboxylase biotin carboxyl carrier protein [Rhizobium sp. BC49]MDR9762373.1 acetyl-CoA carboxylase biotin carboxyl ca
MVEKKSGIDQALIRDLANILNETDLTEIEVEQDDLRIRVSRAGTQQYVQAPIAAPAYAAPAAATPAAAGAAPAAAPARNPANTVSAPMVGTVYMAPAPGARPFIEVGATVKEGQTLIIIEAMKTMNQIPSPKSGKVTEILVDDGHPVEYGQALVVIE